MPDLTRGDGVESRQNALDVHHVPILVRRLPRVDAVRMQFEKWGRRPQWKYDTVRLGRDDHGTWLGVTPGTATSRHWLAELAAARMQP